MQAIRSLHPTLIGIWVGPTPDTSLFQLLCVFRQLYISGPRLYSQLILFGKHDIEVVHALAATYVNICIFKRMQSCTKMFISGLIKKSNDAKWKRKVLYLRCTDLQFNLFLHVLFVILKIPPLGCFDDTGTLLLEQLMCLKCNKRTSDMCLQCSLTKSGCFNKEVIRCVCNHKWVHAAHRTAAHSKVAFCVMFHTKSHPVFCC